MKRSKTKKVRPDGHNAIDAYISARMRERRREINMTQDELGKAFGISFQQIQKYEKGVNRVSASRLYEICKVLNVPMSSMFERDPKA